MEQRVITAVGRSSDSHTFVHEVATWLFDSYGVEGVHSLGDKSDVDGKERFIAFCIGFDMENFTADKVVGRLIEAGFSAAVFDDLDDAIVMAKEKYDFGEMESFVQSKMEQIREAMPPLTAAEVEQAVVFNALFSTGNISLNRGTFNDEPVVVLTNVVKGADEVRATPLAMLVTEKIAEGLVMPWDL